MVIPRSPSAHRTRVVSDPDVAPESDAVSQSDAVSETSTAGRPRGFTFIEVLVVMAIMAVLMGIGFGYLKNIGATTGLAQARAILKETAYACKQSSNGGVQAIYSLRMGRRADGSDALMVGAAVARPVLTHNFETLDFASSGFPAEVGGSVEIDAVGYHGRAARFLRGGTIAFGRQSAFAMTEGILLDVWIRPEAGPPTMTVLRGEGAYDVSLLRAGTGTGYDVRLKLNTREAADERTVPAWSTMSTKGAPVPADGRTWTHLVVRFDGAESSIRTNGLEHAVKAGGTTTEQREGDLRRLVVPEGGAVALTISAADTPFVGLMDSLKLGGVFRSPELNRELKGVSIVSPKLPLRVLWRNGKVYGQPDDVRIRIHDTRSTEGADYELVLGRDGTIREGLVQ